MDQQVSPLSKERLASNDFICDLKEAAIWTIAAFDSRLFTDATNPFVRAGQRISGLSSLPALEAARINIFSPSEKRAKQGYFGER